MIKCSKCKNDKVESDFYFRKDRGSYHAWCRSCMTSYGHARYRARKRQIINIFGGKCSKCSYNKNINALDFHHLDPNEKEFSWSEKKQSKWDILIEELKKCVLLCRNCHAELHWPDNEEDMPVDILVKGMSPTGKCKECDKDVYGTIYCSRECSSFGQHKVKRPNCEQLKNDLSNSSFVALGKKYGVSDNSIRKWAKLYGIL